MAALISFFPITVNLIRGLTSIPDTFLDLMGSLSASKFQILMKLRIPNSLPYLFSAVRISIILSLIGAIIGEFVGSSKGIGHLIILANSQLQTDLLFANLIVLSLIGIFFYFSIDLIDKKVLKWERKDEGSSKKKGIALIR
jgi:NitT/TauT family transport system permease protein